MLQLKPLLLKHLTNGIIAPHGITDILHAKYENNLKELTATYAGTIASTYVLSELNMNSVVNITFFMLSVIHFRRDMPYFKGIPRYVWSFLFLQFTIMNNSILFFLYLVFIHVPHHYRLNWRYIKKNFKLSSLVILGTTLIIEVLGKDMYDLMINDSFMSVIKGVIMSHVVYDELYIFDDENLQNTKK